MEDKEFGMGAWGVREEVKDGRAELWTGQLRARARLCEDGFGQGCCVLYSKLQDVS